MSPLDRDYIEQLIRLGYNEDAKNKVDEFYQKSKRKQDSLFTPEERECYEALLEGGNKEEAEEALDLSYNRRRNVDGDGLSPIDKEYIEILEMMEEEEEIERVKSRAGKPDGSTNGGKRRSRLLTGIDKEYVDELMRLEKRDKARKVVDSIYESRKNREQDLMMKLLDKANKG